MIIAACLYGQIERYRAAAEAWLMWTRHMAPWATIDIFCDRPAKILDQPCQVFPVDWLSDCIRPRYPFDLKPAVFLSALNFVSAGEDLLVIDFDCLIQQDLRPMLKKFASVPLGMTTDQGAFLYDVDPFMTKPFETVLKRCGGCMWFGASERRPAIPGMFRKAWHEVSGLLPWEPKAPYVLEQYVMSIVAHRLGCPVLPATFNWNVRLLGRTDAVLIDHDYGHEKFNGARHPGNPD
jgi:hypothetical protein